LYNHPNFVRPTDSLGAYVTVASPPVRQCHDSYLDHRDITSSSHTNGAYHAHLADAQAAVNRVKGAVMGRRRWRCLEAGWEPPDTPILWRLKS
jgi:hypothetical protein